MGERRSEAVKDCMCVCGREIESALQAELRRDAVSVCVRVVCVCVCVCVSERERERECVCK